MTTNHSCSETEVCPCPACGHAVCDLLVRGLVDVEDRTEGCYAIGQCPQCSFVYLAVRPLLKKQAEHYPSDYHAHAGQSRNAVRDFLIQGRLALRVRRLEQYRLTGASSVLELGCGDGQFLTFLARKWPDVERLVGCDLAVDESMKCNRRLEFVRGTLPDINRGDGFDLVLAYDVVEHLSDPLAAFNGIRSLLKPGGRLVMQVPNWDSVWRRVFPRHWSGLQIPRHLNYFTQASAGYALEKSGLRCLSLRPVFDPGDLSVSVCNWMTDRLRLRTKPRKAWFFMPVTLLCAPIVAVQFAVACAAGEMELLAGQA